MALGKIIISLSLLSLFFSGCTKKEQVQINTYVTSHKHKTQGLKISYLGVEDLRKNNVVATVLKADEIIKQYPASSKLGLWLDDALNKEMANANILNVSDAKTSIKVVINDLSTTYKKYSLNKKNMKVQLDFKIVIINEDKTEEVKIKLNQTAYVPMILDARSFDAITNEILNESVSKIIELIITKIK